MPIVDDIERATAHIPENLTDDTWVQGVASLAKKLESSLEKLDVKRINAEPGVDFNPDLHNAIQMDEGAEGEHEVVAEELQAGYTLDDQPIRHAMVKVTRK